MKFSLIFFITFLAFVKAQISCPADNTGDVVQFPHESDCTKFYKCDRGVAGEWIKKNNFRGKNNKFKKKEYS